MSTYEKSGVNIIKGDKASEIAYNIAKSTFASRQGLKGQPLVTRGAFKAVIDMGDYYLVQNDDGIGTKIKIAESIGKYNTIGYDLLAMVSDDAVCLGAETIAITNTIDTNKVYPNIIKELMTGLAQACIEQKIAIVGGEIGEMKNCVNNHIWNATALGILAKNKLIRGDEIQAGDKVIALSEKGFRSNGFTLVRYILEKEYGIKYYNKLSPLRKKWGELILEPSQVYSNELLKIIGRFGKKKKMNIKKIAHITGGGIIGNIKRIMKNENIGIELNDLFEPSEMMKQIQEIGNVKEEEAYKTWNMGNGMLIILSEKDIHEFLNIIRIKAKVVGNIIDKQKIIIKSKGCFPQNLIFKIN